MEPTFKLAADADTEPLMEMMRELYAYDHLPFDEQEHRSALQQILGNESLGRVYLILLGEVVAGYIVLTLGFSLEYRGRDAILDEFFVKENYRQQGIGKRALRFIEEVCRELGVQALHLVLERGNTNAQAVYRKAGFIDHDRYLMTKWIEESEEGSET